jgi:hypothetical protein
MTLLANAVHSVKARSAVNRPGQGIDTTVKWQYSLTMQDNSIKINQLLVSIILVDPLYDTRSDLNPW